MRVLIMGATGLLGHTLAHAWTDVCDLVTTVNTGWDKNSPWLHNASVCGRTEVRFGHQVL